MSMPVESSPLGVQPDEGTLSQSPSSSPRSETSIRIQLNGEDFAVPENGTEGGITRPCRQGYWSSCEDNPHGFDDFCTVYRDELKGAEGQSDWSYCGESWGGWSDQAYEITDMSVHADDCDRTNADVWGPDLHPDGSVVIHEEAHHLGETMELPTKFDDADDQQGAASPDEASETVTGGDSPLDENGRDPQESDAPSPNIETASDGRQRCAPTKDPQEFSTAAPNIKTASDGRQRFAPNKNATMTPASDLDTTAEVAMDPENTHDRGPGNPSKKRSRKNKNMNRGPTALSKFRGTGFEENYADPPMTPEEHEEEKRIYDPEHPFDDRIEECIQRFRGRRRLDSTRTMIFSRYLSLGGIDTTQRQFTGACGMTKEQLDYRTPAEMREIMANDVIQRSGTSLRYYTPGDDGWEVDFTGVVSSYISRLLPIDVAGDSFLMKLGVETILNWINYVDMHDACPEYAADLARAREVCKTALVELPLIQSAVADGPGQFNFACRKIFGLDEPAPAAGDDSVWTELGISDVNRKDGTNAGLVFISSIIILAGALTAQGTPPPPGLLAATELFKSDPELKGMVAGVVGIDKQSEQVRIVEILPAGHETTKLFRGIIDIDKIVHKYRPAGLLVAEPCIIEDGWANTPKLHDSPPLPATRQAFIMDDRTLSKLRQGMRLQLDTVTVRHRDFELKFVKDVRDIVASFYQFLPQELMLDFKDPRPCYRRPPSVDCPEGEVGSRM